MTTNPSRITIIQAVLSLLIVLISVAGAIGQQDLVFTQKFTDLLDKYELVYERPVEKWFQIQPDERRYAEYDMVIRTYEQDLEIRHIIRKHPSDEPPQVHGPLLLSHVATNLETADILFTRMNSTMLEQFAADWGMYADFTPKKAVTEYKYARLVSIFRQEGPLAHTLLLRNEPFASPESEEWCIIRFIGDKEH